MTASTASASRGRRTRRGRLPSVLFWSGVMLTPVAGLGIWFAHGGGPLRGAALLALLGTVLIGLSVVLRRDDEGTRLELQENVLAEVEALRTELGTAMTTALQRVNHGTHAELAALQEQVDQLAGQVSRVPAEAVAARTAGSRAGEAAAPAVRPADPMRDSMGGVRPRDPMRDSMGGPRPVDPMRDSMGGARPVDPLRDSASRPDPWAGLRGDDPAPAPEPAPAPAPSPEPPAPSPAPAPASKPRRRARHRAED